MKKLINDPADVVADALLGVAAAHPELRVDHEHKIVYRGDAPVTGKVGLISGGGSGHEPLHGGFVGLGMLDAACAGEVFTSPVPDQMLAATRTVDGGAGVLHIVKNYTGDVMNFEMAAELAAAETGVEVISVVTDDDVAVQDSLYTAGPPRRRRHRAGGEDRRRGGGGGPQPGRGGRGRAARERQRPQHGHGAHLLHGARRRKSHVRPARRRDGDRHRHPRRAGPPPGAVGARRRDRASCWSSRSSTDLDFKGGDGVIAFVNGMGATPLIELYLMYNEVAKILEKAGVTVARSLVGPYITSLDMAGCSVTLLKLDDELLRLWDAPVRTPGLRWGV